MEHHHSSTNDGATMGADYADESGARENLLLLEFDFQHLSHLPHLGYLGYVYYPCATLNSTL